MSDHEIDREQGEPSLDELLAERPAPVEDESFEALFAANPTVPVNKGFKPGDRVKGRVTTITSEAAFVDLGAKQEGIVFLHDLLGDKEELEIHEGDELELKIVSIGPDGIQLSKGMRLHGSQEALDAIEEAWSSDVPIEGRVVAVNKGGFDVEIGKVKAFCPVSQIDNKFVEDTAPYVGVRDLFMVTQFSEGGRRIVVSRRAILEATKQARIAELKDHLFEGEELEGRVTKLMPFGAFVDIGGLEGMVHISELSRRRVENPSEVVTVGQEVRVKVLRMDEDDKGRTRVALSMKALEQDPWEAGLPFVEDAVVRGKVARLQPFGAFIELLPGVDGLLHVSEISYERIAHPSAVLAEGQEVEARVLSIDFAKKRVSLSMKALMAAPRLERAEGESGAPRQQPVYDTPGVGKSCEGVVDNIKPYGVFIALPAFGSRTRGLLPLEEIEGNTADLRKRFLPGTKVNVEIINIDELGRLRLSQRAAGVREERANIDTYVRSTEKPTAVATGGGLGSFGKLLQSKIKS